MSSVNVLRACFIYLQPVLLFLFTKNSMQELLGVR